MKNIQKWLAGHIGDVVIILISLLLLGTALLFAAAHQAVQYTDAESDAILEFVDEFGTHMQYVSLLAPQKDVEAAMDTHYAAYLSPDLLAKWKASPSVALGKTVSSPWPSGIRLKSVQKVGIGSYIVKGTVLLSTSTGPASSTDAIILGITHQGELRIVEIATTTPAALSI